ncbi:MAG: Raf kinase inhibitor-like YbhB/YbcL family protein [Bradymonadia bacterium]|jgi:Raf kinase inhibitor-like YbhB/YbcL family protein
MSSPFSVRIDAFAAGTPIPPRFAFGQPGTDGPFAFGGNVSPRVEWSNAPEGTLSFAVICHDPDVPSAADDVNQEGKTVPADLPRMTFFHWVLVDVPAATTSIAEGSSSEGITARGKALGQTSHGVTGLNDYTSWFAGDPDMDGKYGGYDGPCPPWNDSIVHHYNFTVFALSVENLGLSGSFTGQEARDAMVGHILAEASHMGTYSMNPAVPA